VPLGIDKEVFLSTFNNDVAVPQIKFQQKYGRQNGIHVSPSFMINGLINPDPSSSWDVGQWKQLLDPLFKSQNE